MVESLRRVVQRARNRKLSVFLVRRPLLDHRFAGHRYCMGVKLRSRKRGRMLNLLLLQGDSADITFMGR